LKLGVEKKRKKRKKKKNMDNSDLARLFSFVVAQIANNGNQNAAAANQNAAAAAALPVQHPQVAQPAPRTSATPIRNNRTIDLRTPPRSEGDSPPYAGYDGESPPPPSRSARAEVNSNLKATPGSVSTGVGGGARRSPFHEPVQAKAPKKRVSTIASGGTTKRGTFTLPASSTAAE
jgi:hypothetical protein